VDHDLKNNAGITLIELLLAVAILGLLVAIALPSYNRYVERTKVAAAVTDITVAQLQIDAFYVDNNRLPTSLDEVGLGSMRDAWGNPYQYLSFEGVEGKGLMRKDRNLVPVNTDYDLYSMGADGRTTQPFTSAAGRDDIVRANNGRYVGLASDY
jgi:general secretion pathway protein G